jgi:hypothetical protein
MEEVMIAKCSKGSSWVAEQGCHPLALCEGSAVLAEVQPHGPVCVLRTYKELFLWPLNRCRTHHSAAAPTELQLPGGNFSPSASAPLPHTG